MSDNGRCKTVLPKLDGPKVHSIRIQLRALSYAPNWLAVTTNLLSRMRSYLEEVLQPFGPVPNEVVGQAVGFTGTKKRSDIRRQTPKIATPDRCVLPLVQR
jgi:hypothetical protein